MVAPAVYEFIVGYGMICAVLTAVFLFIDLIENILMIDIGIA